MSKLRNRFGVIIAAGFAWLAATSSGLYAEPQEVISSGPVGPATLELIGRGARLAPGATTDVFAHEGYAYLGTFNAPCGDGTGANGSGIRIFHSGAASFNKPEVAVIPSPEGSRANDVKVAAMNSGDILVHSNERCLGGPGGVELYNVDNPLQPVHLASLPIKDRNRWLLTRDKSEIRVDQKEKKNPNKNELSGPEDVTVHNNFLFSRDGRDYLAVMANSRFGNFQLFDISDPRNPVLVGTWGAEELVLVDNGKSGKQKDPENVAGKKANTALQDLAKKLDSGSNGYLHDITISADGSKAYLSNWDSGLVLLDISDVSDPKLIGVGRHTLQPDGTIVSHAAWPSADGSVVVETAEDFFIKPEGSNPVVLTTPFSVRYAPTGNGNQFEIEEIPFEYDEDLGTDLQMGLDTYVEVPFAAGFPFVGELKDAVFVNSSGNITLNRGVVDYTSSIEEFRNVEQRIAPFWGDIDPRGGRVLVKELADRLVVTYENIPYYSDGTPETTTTVQVVLYSSGVVEMHYKEIDTDIQGDGANLVMGISAAIQDSALVTVEDYLAGLPQDVVLGTFAVLYTNVFEASNWGNVRIWDFSDPSAPVLASTFDTVCSGLPYSAGCDYNKQTYSVHNVIVEGDLAYFSWYGNGVLVVDVSEPSSPVEIARYDNRDAAWESQNGGGQDYWGIYKIPGQPEIYASDRNGGLYILQLNLNDGN